MEIGDNEKNFLTTNLNHLQHGHLRPILFKYFNDMKFNHVVTQLVNLFNSVDFDIENAQDALVLAMVKRIQLVLEHKSMEAKMRYEMENTKQRNVTIMNPK